MKIKKVKIALLPEETSDDFSTRMYRKCAFCEKTVLLNQDNFFSCGSFVRSGKFFCPFCIRNNFHTKNSQHVLILSFRAIFAHYYYHHYCDGQGQKIYLSEINKMIFQHEKAGLRHPAFHYDSDNYLWFVNFLKIGKYEEAVHVLTQIIQCFKITEIYYEHTYTTIFDKFHNAFRVFNLNRKRRNRMLIPTFKGCFSQEFKNQYYSNTKNFLPNLLKTC